MSRHRSASSRGLFLLEYRFLRDVGRERSAAPLRGAASSNEQPYASARPLDGFLNVTF